MIVGHACHLLSYPLHPHVDHKTTGHACTMFYYFLVIGYIMAKVLILFMLGCADLCLDEETDSSNEFEANSIQFVDLHMTNIASRRYRALCKQKHLCIELGGEKEFD